MNKLLKTDLTEKQERIIREWEDNMTSLPDDRKYFILWKWKEDKERYYAFKDLKSRNKWIRNNEHIIDYLFVKSLRPNLEMSMYKQKKVHLAKECKITSRLINARYRERHSIGKIKTTEEVWKDIVSGKLFWWDTPITEGLVAGKYEVVSESGDNIGTCEERNDANDMINCNSCGDGDPYEACSYNWWEPDRKFGYLTLRANKASTNTIYYEIRSAIQYKKRKHYNKIME